MSEHDDIQRLLDIAEIRALKAKYCLYLDTKRFEDWRGLFTEDLRVEGTSRPAPRDEFVDNIAGVLADVQTLHQVHEPLIEFAGPDVARGVWPMFDDLRFPAGHAWSEGLPRRIGYGHYEEEYRKDDGAWRISVLRLARLFVWRGEDGVPVPGGVPSAGAEWLAGIAGEPATA